MRYQRVEGFLLWFYPVEGRTSACRTQPLAVINRYTDTSWQPVPLGPTKRQEVIMEEERDRVNGTINPLSSATSSCSGCLPS